MFERILLKTMGAVVYSRMVHRVHRLPPSRGLRRGVIEIVVVCIAYLSIHVNFVCLFIARRQKRQTCVYCTFLSMPLCPHWILYALKQ